MLLILLLLTWPGVVALVIAHYAAADRRHDTGRPTRTRAARFAERINRGPGGKASPR